MSNQVSEDITIKIPRGRVYELRANVTGYLPGGLSDWPPNIQDEIYAAMQRLQTKTKIREFDVLQAFCTKDVDDEPYYVVVTVVEKKKPTITRQVGHG
jgi:hypothetical protein